MDGEKEGCCTPARGNSAGVKPSEIAPGTPFFPLPVSRVEGGTALIGTRTAFLPDDGEAPLRRKKIKPFHITQTTITNAAFAQFVEDTGYVTEAEQIGWSFVFFSDVPAAQQDSQAVAGIEWWRKIDGAIWNAPHGPGSAIAGPDHPVVQISWNDAIAYAAWCGARLPTEAEWEHAARGGLADVRFPWGDAEPDDTQHMPCNIWQGRFPQQNTGADGWAHTAPAQSYEPNGYGLFNMVGNVWEWTSEPFRVTSLKKGAQRKMESMRGHKLLKGGSFLCHRSYCYRYRIAARNANTPDSATPHQGFRVVWDAE